MQTEKEKGLFLSSAQHKQSQLEAAEEVSVCEETWNAFNLASGWGERNYLELSPLVKVGGEIQSFRWVERMEKAEEMEESVMQTWHSNTLFCEQKGSWRRAPTWTWTENNQFSLPILEIFYYSCIRGFNSTQNCDT